LEGYKAQIILEEMILRLTYLDSLKANMGEEMAEQMSEEITKVMEEQKDLERTYAQLVTQRSELTGLSNKAKL
jgi:ribonucleotide reductase beta subunit family protein with ferritin-like domain